MLAGCSFGHRFPCLRTMPGFNNQETRRERPERHKTPDKLQFTIVLLLKKKTSRVPPCNAPFRKWKTCKLNRRGASMKSSLPTHGSHGCTACPWLFFIPSITAPIPHCTLFPMLPPDTRSCCCRRRLPHILQEGFPHLFFGSTKRVFRPLPCEACVRAQMPAL